MVKCNATKDGEGNIIITEDSFDFLLACLANQKFNKGAPPEHQEIIDDYYDQCRKVLHQKYIFETVEDGYFLTKKYLYQDDITPWSGNDVYKVYELFKNTKMEYKKPEPISNDSTDLHVPEIITSSEGWFATESESRTWVIERAIRYDNSYLTISEDGIKNRPWKREEIEDIQNIFDGLEVKDNGYYKEELWQDQLSKMDNYIIEKYLRKLKLEKL